MKPTIEQRLHKLEAARAAQPRPFDFRAAYGVDREKFGEAMSIIQAARDHRICHRTPSKIYSHAIDISSTPAPYEPQCPEDWSTEERTAWPRLIEIYDKVVDFEELIEYEASTRRASGRAAT